MKMKNLIKIGAPGAYKYAKYVSKSLWGPEKLQGNYEPYEQYKPFSHKINNTILEAIGHTPLVKLNKITKTEGIECEILAKCEYMNPGGSQKDRISLRMISDAEKEGKIKPGDTLIEITSGNTGIGMALVAAIKGYRMIVLAPEKTSKEKITTLQCLGAEVIVVPANVTWNSPQSFYSIFQKIHDEIPNSHYLGQYSNPSNPLAHYEGTAEELIDQCEGKIDYVFMGAGTGGTISGIGRKFKEKMPNCKIIGVDPYGSILALPEELNEIKPPAFHVEGIGDDFIPKTLDRNVIDQWIKINDKESFFMARRLIKEEGLLCGGSAGMITAAAVQYAKEMKLGKDVRCVVILPDSVRNYVTKFVSDSWMIRNGFMSMDSLSDPKHPLFEVEWQTLELNESRYVKKNATIAEVSEVMGHNTKYIPVVDGEKVVGYISSQSLMNQVLVAGKTSDQPATSAIIKDVQIVIILLIVMFLLILF